MVTNNFGYMSVDKTKGTYGYQGNGPKDSSSSSDNGSDDHSEGKVSQPFFSPDHNTSGYFENKEAKPEDVDILYGFKQSEEIIGADYKKL